MGRPAEGLPPDAGNQTPVGQAEPAPASSGPIAPQPFTAASRWVVVTLLALAAVYLVIRLRGIVTLVLLSALLAYVLSPVVDLVSHLAFHGGGRALPRWAAILVVFATLGVLLTAGAVLVLPPLVEQVVALVTKLPGYYEQIAGIIADLRRISRAQLSPEWRAAVEGYLGQAGAMALTAVRGSLGAFLGLLASLVAIVLIPILTYFMLLAAPGVRGSLLAWFPADLRPEVDFLMAEVNLVMLKFLRGRLIVAGIIGVLVGVGTLALGVPYPLVLGLSAGLLDLIPFIGPVLAGVPAVGLALLDDPGRALWVAGLYIAVQQLEQLVLSPKIEGGELALNPAVVILAATAAGTLFGILGVLLAVPITALVRIGLLYVRAKLHGEPLRSLGQS